MFYLIIYSAAEDDPQAALVPRFGPIAGTEQPYVKFLVAPDSGVQCWFLPPSTMVQSAANVLRTAFMRADPVKSTLDGLAFLAGAVQSYRQTGEYVGLKACFAALASAVDECPCLDADHRRFLQEGYPGCFNMIQGPRLWDGIIELLYMIIGQVLREHENA